MMVKRISDSILSIAGVIFTIPLSIIFSLLIYIRDRGDVLYCQERVGSGGRIFKSYQFRSMVLDAEKLCGPVQSMGNDPRVTNIGKILRTTALDELPQLINILKGDISFVGPRALRPEEKEVGSDVVKSLFEYPGFKERSKVRPGLTGVAQILLPRNAPREVKFKYDIWYIKHQSLWLDLYLIFLSFIVTFQGKWETRDDKLGGLVRRLKERIDKDLGEKNLA